MTAVSRSPLHDVNESLGARFTDFGGWEMPLQYAGTLVEHEAVRDGVGIFDVSHLGRFRITGTDAVAASNRLLCNDLRSIGPGRCQYTMMLTEEGGVIDDIIVWWIDGDELIILPNGVNHDTVRDAFADDPADLSVTDLRDTTVLLAVQGPAAPTLVEQVTGIAPRRFRVATTDSHVFVAGTGYTGEPGAEIIAPLDRGEALFRSFLDAGATPCGLGARDTLRLEMGFPLWGQDLDHETTPLEAGLGWVVGWDHDFVGRSALEEQRSGGLDRVLVGFRFDTRRVPRHGYPMRSGNSVGQVTSGNFSPSLGVGIGLGYLSPPATDDTIEVEIRGDWHSASRVDPPFVSR